MSECPYCGSGALDEVSTERKRHPHHKTVRCGSCSGHSVRMLNGKVFPLVNLEDKESDAVQKVR